MSMAYACDHDGCDTFQRRERARSGWLAVHELDGTAEPRVWHFCSYDCMLLHFGRRAPGVEISTG